MNQKRWVSPGSAATAEISLDRRLQLAWLMIKAASASPRNDLRCSWNFSGDASVWTVALVCEREQTAIVL